ncbi:EscU/YscU/HrcU family type III secretion system export apparatus switch protein [Pseudaquabacterium pictum]|uniref:Flagellar biosynthetic protein FlhB n=1 Tax=Pseudaquabacterium pictum TaxID=2315236 RepID=A0A480AX06_9BURK|nr:EscU/YscU/HrcU family type III secretion system export apparatus switch protein [Rubrivivax pictus]GCL65921.1 flagellar biosynthesis protein FlhB [Rubrivivax pictus]
MADAQERNLPASEKKIRKARREGQVARSRDLAHLLVVGGGGALLVVALPQLADWSARLLASGLRFDLQALSQADAMTRHLGMLTWAWMVVLLPLGALGILLVVGAALASGGWNFTWQPLAPNFGKLNPLTGLGRMVSGQHLGDLAKACLLALLLGVAGGLWLWLHLGQFHDALAMPLPTALAHTGGALLDGLMLLVIVLAVFAAIDVPLQRRMLANRLKMSHQEAKQEHKEAEGNVEMKGRIKSRMREMSRKRMLAAVPKADLVVMNPTHYAVALKYDEGRMAAPKVVAKGADLLALKIRDLAREHKVPVLQAAPLARALYAHSEVDHEIPARLFSAVAQVLAYVYQLRAAMAGRAAMPHDLPPIVVPPDLDPHTAEPAPV